MYAKILPYDKKSGMVGAVSHLVSIEGGASSYGTHWSENPWPSCDDLGFEFVETIGVYGDPNQLAVGTADDQQQGYVTKWLVHGRGLEVTHGDIYLVGDNGKTIDKVR